MAGLLPLATSGLSAGTRAIEPSTAEGILHGLTHPSTSSAPTSPQGALWTNVTTQHSGAPQDRGYGGMAFDTAANEYILYGGEDGGTSALSDTWGFTPASGWSDIAPSKSPGGDAEPAMAYDSTSSEVVLFGGCTGINLLSSDCNFDTSFAYAGGNWASIGGTQPTGVLAAGMADDPAQGGVLLFGGCDDFSIDILAETGSCASNGFVDTTSLYTVSAGWKTLSLSSQPSAREAPGMAYDPQLGEIVLFGGSPNGAACLGDTWVFKGGAWTNITSTLAVSPPARANFAMFYDAEAQEIIAFSGDGAATIIDDTWAFNGTWTQLFPATSPAGRDGMGAAGGDATTPPALFGGSVINSSYQSDTWTLDVLRVNAAATPASADVGTPISFTAVPIGGSGAVTGSWDFGDGSNSTVANTSHTYLSPGTYTATFTAKDALGITAAQPVIITIAPLPTVTAAASPTTLTLGNATSFWANATGGAAPYKYSWTFGDGQVSALPDPTHTYAGPGVYSAQVILTDNGGHTASNSVNITVNAPIGALAASFSATPQSGLVPLNVSFVSKVSGGTSPYTYDWNFGDGSPLDSASNVSHTYATIGTFTATLTVTDMSGASTPPYSVTVTVKPGPLSLTLAATPTSGTSPLTVDFTSTPSGGDPPYTYAWSFGDGATSDASDPSHVYNYTGSNSTVYTADLMVSDTAGGGQSVEREVNITVSGVAPLAIVPDIPSSASVGTAADLSVSVTGGISPYNYTWNYGDGTANATFQGQNTTSHAYTAAGPYTVTVWVMDARGHTVEQSGQIDVSSTGGTTTTGGGGTSIGGGGPYFWAWILGPPLIVAALAAYAYALVRTSQDQGQLGATGRSRPTRGDRSTFMRRVQ